MTQRRKPTPKKNTSRKKANTTRPKSVKSRVNSRFSLSNTAERKKATPSATAKKRAELNKHKTQTRNSPAVDKASYESIIHDLSIVFKGQQVHVLTPPWEEKDVVRALGGEYSPRIKQWIVTGELDPRLAPYKPKPFSLAKWFEDGINGRPQTINRADKLFTPRPHQQEGIDAVVAAAKAGWRGFIEADDTGIGKTLTGLLAASEVATLRGFTATNRAKLLVLSVNGSLPNWRNTIERTGINNLDILLINYEQVNKLLIEPKTAATAKRKSTKNRQTAAKGSPFIHWDLIIVDESQKIKNVTSQRTQAFQQVAEYTKPAKNAPFVIWMSATVAQTPLEAAYLAPLIGQASRQPLTLKTWPQWLHDNGFHVTATSSGGWKWVKPQNERDRKAIQQQEADLKRLSSILFAPKSPSIRRLATDIAGWPAQNRIGLPVELTVNATARYRTLWTQFREEMRLAPKGRDPQSQLAAQLRFAQKASLLRTTQTTELILEALETGKQVAVSLRFIESLDAIKRDLQSKGVKVSEYSGRNVATREQERIAFQKGITTVILFTVKESVSFHAGEELRDGTKGSTNERVLFLHDIHYSAMDLKQITGRTHRDGQNSVAYLLYAEGTVEEQITDIMLLKLKNMTILSGDDESEGVVEIQRNLGLTV